jgi:hypothetical protein
VLIFKASVILIIILNCISLRAYQPSDGDVTAYFGPYFHRTNFETTKTGATSPVLGGIGLVALGDVSDKGSLEIAMLYMNKIYLREDAGKYISERTGLMHITMGYRRWFNDTFSASLSLSSGYSRGDTQVLHSDFTTGSEIATSARDTTLYGFDLSLLTELVKIKRTALVLDARYALSATSKQNEKSDQFILMLALQFLVQEKFPEKIDQIKPDSSF